MFYGIVFGLVAVSAIILTILKFTKYKENEKFDSVVKKLGKIFALIYCSLVFVSIFLPDGFALSLDSDVALSKNEKWFSVIRWLNCIPFVVLPVAAFSQNKTFRNLAIYFCLPIALVSIGFYSKQILYFTAENGRGLTTLPFASEGFKAFLTNPIFRSIWFGLVSFVQVLVSLFVIFREKIRFEFKSWRSWVYFFLILIGLAFSLVPIYVPQYLVGYTNILLEPYSIWHFAWLFIIAAESVGLYFVFRKKSFEDKWLLCVVLALCLFLQYNSFFQCIGSINFKRLPVQLCNIGAYLILISLLTKKQRLFNFTLIVNVVGVLFAVAIPDINGEGVGYLWNLHFVFEHTNVFIVPILALCLGVFKRLDYKALRDSILGFVCYFAAVFVLGTLLNGIAVMTTNDYFEVNWLFMFDQNAASKLLPAVGNLFNINFSLGAFVFYPVIQLIILAVFLVACVVVFFVIKLIYFCHDTFLKKKKVKNDNIIFENQKENDIVKYNNHNSKEKKE